MLEPLSECGFYSQDRPYFSDVMKNYTVCWSDSIYVILLFTHQCWYNFVFTEKQEVTISAWVPETLQQMMLFSSSNINFLYRLSYTASWGEIHTNMGKTCKTQNGQKPKLKPRIKLGTPELLGGHASSDHQE